MENFQLYAVIAVVAYLVFSDKINGFFKKSRATKIMALIPGSSEPVAKKLKEAALLSED